VKGCDENRKTVWHFIPGCMGGAATGPEACTCASASDKVKKLERRMDELSMTVAALEKFLEQQFADGTGETKPIIVEFDAMLARRRENERQALRVTADFLRDS
jgi:hypothetical protein